MSRDEVPSEEALVRALQAARRGDLGVRFEGDGALAREWNAFMEDARLHVRNLSDHARAVARGDVSVNVHLPFGGEMNELKVTVNSMTDTLRAFGEEVARVAARLDAAGALSAVEASPFAGLWRSLAQNVSVTEQLAVASRAKSEFLANMSHELRTPLNSLLILARLLADNPDHNLTERQVEYARTIHGAGTDLLELINDILDLSKIEAGKMRVEPRPVALADVVARIDRDVRALAEQRDLRLTIELDAAAPPAVHADPQRLLQILKNLISNAIKFTPRGAVTLRITADAGGVAFAVTDTGIGIPADKLDLIFDAFQQADGSTARKYGGTGLGLSISRGFARLLGGELRVTSTPGTGSTFTLWLPTPAATSPSPATSAAPSPAAPPITVRPATAAPAAITGAPLGRRPALVGRRVLVIDDDVRNLFALASLLETQDLRPAFAESATAGLDHLHRSAFDLVLLDIMMPDLDGYELLRRLRADATFHSLPILAVTARALPGDRERCLDAGATAYLAKPVDADLLLSTMAELLEPTR